MVFLTKISPFVVVTAKTSPSLMFKASQISFGMVILKLFPTLTTFILNSIGKKVKPQHHRYPKDILKYKYIHKVYLVNLKDIQGESS